MKVPALTKTYENKLALSTAELEIESGLVYAVIGANGSGKSTLAKILAGVIDADEKWKTPQEINIGYMPQKAYPFTMSVLRNLTLSGGSKEKARQMLEAFGIAHLERSNATELSGGETARMAMARLLMQDFDMIILDEPTAAMDVTAAQQAEQILMEYHRRTGCTVLLITHSLKQARRLADKIIFMKDGKLVEFGNAALLDNPTQSETKEFLDFYSL